MLWMTIGTLHYLTGCYQHKNSSAPGLRDWRDSRRETKWMIYCRFGSTAHLISSRLCSALPDSKQHKHFHSRPLRCVMATRGLKKIGTKMGWEGPEEKPRSPSGSDSSDRPGDLLEQRATGGRQLFKWGGASQPLRLLSTTWLRWISLFRAFSSQCWGQNMSGQPSQLPRSLASQ